MKAIAGVVGICLLRLSSGDAASILPPPPGCVATITADDSLGDPLTLKLAPLAADLDRRIAASRNVTFDQETRRYFRKGSGLHSDSFTASVRFVDGAEEYRAIRRNNRNYRSLHQLGGPYIMGELTSVLTVTRGAFGHPGILVTTGVSDDCQPLIEVRFHVRAREMGWLLVVGSSTHALDFDGVALFSALNDRLLEIDWRAASPRLPLEYGIDTVSWTISFSVSLIAGAAVVVPVGSKYRVNYIAAAHRTEWVESTFLNYRRFGTTSDLTFAGECCRRFP
jgi:hypothetical protein